eukprot:217251-Pleurochrysis_carterae.AAC.1
MVLEVWSVRRFAVRGGCVFRRILCAIGGRRVALGRPAGGTMWRIVDASFGDRRSGDECDATRDGLCDGEIEVWWVGSV